MLIEGGRTFSHPHVMWSASTFLNIKCFTTKKGSLMMKHFYIDICYSACIKFLNYTLHFEFKMF